MKRLDSLSVGIDQGTSDLFSDFEDDGEMWSGKGPRISRTAVTFSEIYAHPPAVTVGLSMFDMSNSANARVDLQAENVTAKGFETGLDTATLAQAAQMARAMRGDDHV